jgi:hypothetical protein
LFLDVIQNELMEQKVPIPDLNEVPPVPLYKDINELEVGLNCKSANFLSGHLYKIMILLVASNFDFLPLFILLLAGINPWHL